MEKILVIEDEESVRTSIRDLLNEKGYTVYLAGGGLEGVDVATQIIPDLIVCDVMMGDIDGFMVLETLQENIKTNNIPFLFLTAKADIADVRKGMSLGADDYLLKPFKAKDLLKSIEVRINKFKDTSNRFQLIWENANEGMCLIDTDGKISMYNKAFSKIVESENTLNEKMLYTLFKNENILMINLDDEAETSKEFTLWNGNKKWLEIKKSLFKSSIGHSFIILLVSDITEKKKNEIEILYSLKEKEVLLKEIHHRVKNNLQIISSLLSLQSSYLTDQASQEIFIESQNRIKSMSLIHEKLYQTSDLSSINLGDYVEELINYLIVTYDNRSTFLIYELSSDDIILHIDTAIPLGIIFNELITNSIKHAFNNKMEGKINISINKDSSNIIKIKYSDDGTGMKDDIDIYKTKTLGLSLIVNLVEQLNGSLDYKNINPGLEYSITFKDELT